MSATGAGLGVAWDSGEDCRARSHFTGNPTKRTPSGPPSDRIRISKFWVGAVKESQNWSGNADGAPLTETTIGAALVQEWEPAAVRGNGGQRSRTELGNKGDHNNPTGFRWGLHVHLQQYSPRPLDNSAPLPMRYGAENDSTSSGRLELEYVHKRTGP